MKELKPIPEIGKLYHFFDDGKSSDSRHYIAKCMHILTKDEAKNKMFELPKIDEETQVEIGTYQISLYQIWKDELKNWEDSSYKLFAEDTDYFIGAKCPDYDEYELWFVRTINGEWFSLDIQSWWQGGILDVDSSRYNYIIEDRTKYEKKPYHFTRTIEDYKD